jgi:hypothetical protein
LIVQKLIKKARKATGEAGARRKSTKSQDQDLDRRIGKIITHLKHTRPRTQGSKATINLLGIAYVIWALL